jgi:uncharacterized membrane protein HdeD (DUF308 family)
VSAAPVVVPRPRVAAWSLAAVRALLALVLGLAITFTGGHSAGFGLVAFGLFGAVAGVVLLIGALLVGAGAARGSAIVQAVVTLVAGIAALVLAGGGVIALIGIVSAFGIVSGALELIGGLRGRRTEAGARDAIITGALTVLLGVAFLLVPPGYTQALGGIQKITGTLTASVVLVGVLGAWGILVGVLQAISAVSLRGIAREAARATAADGPADGGAA